MRFFDNVKSALRIDTIKAERELWAKENMEEEFNIELARTNIKSAEILLPFACIISVVFVVCGLILNGVGIKASLFDDLIIYPVLFVMSLIFYIVIKILSADIGKNNRKILITMYVMSCVYLIWASFLVMTGGRSTTAVVVYASAITIITQAIYLKPLFSCIFVISGTVSFGVITLFEDPKGEIDYHVTIGILLLSLVSYSVSYSRYYNRCRVIYKNKVITSQNRRLDEMVAQLSEQKVELEHTNRNLETAYICDRLTGLYNRWYWDENISKMTFEYSGNEKDTAIMMIDLDNFKMINDAYGHAIGDICLVHVASVLKKNVNAIDNCNVFRMGGEEFVVFCKAIGKPEALKLANQILKDISNIKIDGFDGMLTASIGVHIEALKSEDSIDGLLVKADNAMYDAKKQGKNRIVISLP